MARDPVKRRISGRRASLAFAARNRERLREYSRKYLHSKKGMPLPTRPEPTLCECCSGTSKRHLALDHDHATGVFRGWLCANCNTGIGKLGDTVAGLRRAIAYLERACQK